MLRDLDVSKSTRAKARAYLLNSMVLCRRSKYTALLATLGTGIQMEVCEEVFSARISVVPYFRFLKKNLRLQLFREVRYALFSPGEEIAQPKTLVIITNTSGQIGYHGRYHYFGEYIFEDFLTSDEDLPDLAVSVHYTHAATLSRSAVNDICARNPSEAWPIVKARAKFAILKFARVLKRRRRASLANSQTETLETTRMDVLAAGFRRHDHHSKAIEAHFGRLLNVLAPKDDQWSSSGTPAASPRRVTHVVAPDDDPRAGCSDLLFGARVVAHRRSDGETDEGDGGDTLQQRAIDDFAAAFQAFRSKLAGSERDFVDAVVEAIGAATRRASSPRSYEAGDNLD